MRRLLIIALTAAMLASCTEIPEISGSLGSAPEIFPDYSDVTVPCNIAPLNFRYDGDCPKSFLILESGSGRICVEGPEFNIPEKKWRELCTEGDIIATVCVKEDDGWKSFDPFVIHVSGDPIDPYVAYRLIPPGYETWYRMGLYQRCLENFEQAPIMTNDKTDDNCMNCHSFCDRNPSQMMFHMRAKNGGTYTVRDGKMEKLNAKVVYPRWHPSGKYIAFSVNDIFQFFHTLNPNRIEVYDTMSDLVVYDVEKHELFSTPIIQDSTRFESFPEFSPDGKTLYFCSSPAQKVPVDYKGIRYSICSIAFDPETKEFGNKVDTLYSASASGKGATFPRVSPDGRFLLMTETAYGCFAVWHHDADLKLISLENGSMTSLDGANSPDTESYHCWSSNGRWIIFISRRMDGLYSRLYISHMDENGHASKAFLMPQRDSRYYDREMRSFNVPEFIKGKVEFSMDEMADLAKNETGIKVSVK